MNKQRDLKTKVPVIFCIDIEPDGRAIEPQKKKEWLGVQEAGKRLGNWRASLRRATKSPVRFGWYVRMDPQISHTYGSADWAVTRYSDFFAELKRAEDEIGLHPHCWRWDDSKRNWVSDFASQDWVEHCVRQSFSQFEQCFKRPCQSFRFGDRWLNNETVELIEQLGAQFDLTVEPGRKPEDLPELFTGSLPDYTLAHRRHYRPAAENYLQSGESSSQRNLWMIPISTASLRWASKPTVAKPRRRRDFLAKAARPKSAYEGWFDFVDQNLISGWVYDARHPGDTVCVDVYDNGNFVATYVADFFREDLLREGKGCGAHGFMIPVPEDRKDGQLHQISVKVAGTNFEINHSPRKIVWQRDSGGGDYWTMNLAMNHALFQKFFDLLLIEQQAPFLAFVLRTDAFGQDNSLTEFERNLNYIVSHPMAANLVIDTPAEATKLLCANGA